MFDFGREVCGNLAAAESREWLVTNGIGGFASGTIAGRADASLPRPAHGRPPAAFRAHLLLTKLEETVEYDGIYPENGRFYPLYCNRWNNGSEPEGYKYLNRFHLEGTTPVWTYAIANALLEKRIWMQPGANTTYIQYRLVRATGPLTLEAKAPSSTTATTTAPPSWTIGSRTEEIDHGLACNYDDAPPFYLLSPDADEITPQRLVRRLLPKHRRVSRAKRRARRPHITPPPCATPCALANVSPSSPAPNQRQPGRRPGLRRTAGLRAGAAGAGRRHR
jgi:hypothetical protein